MYSSGDSLGTGGVLRRQARIMKAALLTRGEWFHLTKLAATLKIPKSTMHRCLSALVDEGLLELEADTGRYRVDTDFRREAFAPVNLAVPLLKGSTILTCSKACQDTAIF